MLLSFSTDKCQVNCCHFSISKNTGKPLARTPSSIYIFFFLNCYLIPSGVDHHERDTKPYKGEGIGVLHNSRTERRLLERHTSVTETLKKAVFRSMLLSPSVFSPLFSQLHEMFYQCHHIATHTFVKQVDGGGGVWRGFSTLEKTFSKL